MKGLYSWISVLLLVLISWMGYGQRPMGIKVNKSVICYAGQTDNPCYVPPPADLVKVAGRIKTSTIEVNYNPGFTPQAQQAFDYAIEIWESLIISDVPIKIDAYWSSLGAGTLGAAIYTSAYANFDGAQKLNVFYPVALAEKITGRNLNGNNPDIFMQFSNSADWHYDPLTSAPSGKYDLATVVLHEIVHGLDFAGTFSVGTTTGDYGLQDTTIPIIYDVPIENGSGANLIQTFSSPSAALRTQLTSQSIFFKSPTGVRPRLYAPTEFDSGSSISHLDENTYVGNPDALMTPQIGPQEKIYDPGIAWKMLKDLGWEFVRIVHEPLSDTETTTGPFNVLVTIDADNGFDDESL